MYNYAYAIGTFVFCVIWVALFILLRRSRAAIFWTSLYMAPLGPACAYWLVPSYWDPLYVITISYKGWRFGLEDLFFNFAIAGIMVSLFESVALRNGLIKLPHVTSNVLLKMLGLCTLGYLIMVFLILVPGMNSMIALMVALIMISLLMLYGRWKTFALIIPVAVVFGFLFWLFYISFFIRVFPGVIQAMWNLDSTTGIMLAGVPIEEMLWAITSALFIGPLFRVCFPRSLQKGSIPRNRL